MGFSERQQPKAPCCDCGSCCAAWLVSDAPCPLLLDQQRLPIFRPFSNERRRRQTSNRPCANATGIARAVYPLCLSLSLSLFLSLCLSLAVACEGCAASLDAYRLVTFRGGVWRGRREK